MMRIRLPWRERVAQTWLWWRYSYSFRFAHKPLCSRFRGRVIRIGHFHLCRGCTCLYLGASIAAVLVLLIEMATPVTRMIAYGVAAAAIVSSVPTLYHRLTAGMQDLSRMSAGAAAALLCGFFWWGPWWLGVVNLGALVVVRQVFMVDRRRRLRRACGGCPELGSGQVCSGFALQAAAARRFEEVASERLMHIELPVVARGRQ